MYFISNCILIYNFYYYYYLLEIQMFTINSINSQYLHISLYFDIHMYIFYIIHTS